MSVHGRAGLSPCGVFVDASMEPLVGLTASDRVSMQKAAVEYKNSLGELRTGIGNLEDLLQAQSRQSKHQTLLSGRVRQGVG